MYGIKVYKPITSNPKPAKPVSHTLSLSHRNLHSFIARMSIIFEIDLKVVREWPELGERQRRLYKSFGVLVKALPPSFFCKSYA